MLLSRFAITMLTYDPAETGSVGKKRKPGHFPSIGEEGVCNAQG
jgi:hypothetical protein